MKKITILLAISIISIKTFSQSNEVKFNMATAIAGYPELTYERLIDDDISFGISFATSIEKPEKMRSRFCFTPYSRLYFGKKKSDGFFVEANMILKGQRDVHDEYYYDTLNNISNVVKIDKSTTNFGFGATIGVKLLAKKYAFAELFAGGGRLFGSPINDGYFRGGLTIGFRF